MKLALLLALHPQSEAAAVIATLFVDAPALNDWLVGDRLKEQATPAWFTVKVWPPIEMVPVRGFELGFAATE
jgi:hypothetical protein